MDFQLSYSAITNFIRTFGSPIGGSIWNVENSQAVKKALSVLFLTCKKKSGKLRGEYSTSHRENKNIIAPPLVYFRMNMVQP